MPRMIRKGEIAENVEETSALTAISEFHARMSRFARRSLTAGPAARALRPAAGAARPAARAVRTPAGTTRAAGTTTARTTAETFLELLHLIRGEDLAKLGVNFLLQIF